jgi:hypothetical protein
MLVACASFCLLVWLILSLFVGWIQDLLQQVLLDRLSGHADLSGGGQHLPVGIPCADSVVLRSELTLVAGHSEENEKECLKQFEQRD